MNFKMNFKINKNYLYTLVLFSIFFLSGACFSTSNSDLSAAAYTQALNNAVADEIAKKQPSPSNTNTSKNVPAENRCENDANCSSLCKSIFVRDSQLKCLRSDKADIDIVYQAFQTEDETKGPLVKPKRDYSTNKGNLDDVDLSAIQISERIQRDLWVRAIQRYEIREAEYVLYWLAQKSDAFDLIKDKTKFLEVLFSKLGGIDQLMVTALDLPSVLTAATEEQKANGYFFNLNKNTELGSRVFDLYLQSSCSKYNVSRVGVNPLDKDELQAFCILDKLLCNSIRRLYYFSNSLSKIINSYDNKGFIEKLLKNENVFPTPVSTYIENICTTVFEFKGK